MSRQELESLLAGCGREELAAALEANGLRAPAREGAENLARRLVKAIFWHAHTPLGGALMPDSVDDVVERVVRKAGLELRVPAGDARSRLFWLAQALTPDALFPRGNGVTLDDDDLLDRLRRGTPWGSLAGVSAAGGTAGVRLLSFGFLQATGGTLGRVLPLIPQIAPGFLAARKAAVVASAVTGPLGVALCLVSLNSALGARYDRVLPLLVSAGLLLRPRALLTGPVAA